MRGTGVVFVFLLGANAASGFTWSAAWVKPLVPVRPAVCSLRCAFPTLAEAAEARGLQEGKTINAWEHNEEVKVSQGNFAFMDGPSPHAASIPAKQLNTQSAVEDLLKVSAVPLFSAEECQSIIDEAEEGGGGWVIGGRWHTEFPGIDLPVQKLKRTHAWLDRMLPERIFPFIANALPDLVSDASFLRLNDCFLVKYNAKAGQTSLRAHRDNSLISCNIALNPECEYEGGGTWVEPLDRVVTLGQGHALTHSSSIFHAGNPITGGTRYILVCFLISTEHPEHARRFIQRGAELRTAGMVQAARRSFESALLVGGEARTDDQVHHHFMNDIGSEVRELMGLCDRLVVEHRSRLRLLALLQLHIGMLKWREGRLAEASEALKAAAVIEEGAGATSLAPAAWSLLAGLGATHGDTGAASARIAHAEREAAGGGGEQAMQLTGFGLEEWRAMAAGGGAAAGMTSAWMDGVCRRAREWVEVQLREEEGRLRREGGMDGKMERYLRPVLCELFIEQGIMLERSGASATELLRSCDDALLCDPANQDALEARDFALVLQSRQNAAPAAGLQHVLHVGA